MSASVHKFRFGLQLSSLPSASWKTRVQEIEEMGFSTIFVEDHFGLQWEPQTALSAIAMTSQKINVGSLVYNVDFRHPVLMAKAAATLQLLSSGRHEFGLGAGWMRSDYEQAGIPYDRPGVRIERLEEALQIIRSMWTQERTTFIGKHYSVTDISQAAALPPGASPKIMVGGGGKRLLSVAGRYANIVGINPSIPEGRSTDDTIRQMTPQGICEKISWVRSAAEEAGREFSDIELSSLVVGVAFEAHEKIALNAISAQSGMTTEQAKKCPLFLTGSGLEICNTLIKRREETGVSYIVIQDGDHLEEFSNAVIAPLAGT